MIEVKRENLLGDRAYDSDPLDAELRKDGIDMIAPHRSNRSKPPTQGKRLCPFPYMGRRSRVGLPYNLSFSELTCYFSPTLSRRPARHMKSYNLEGVR
jgi:hypothetical protein